MGRSVAAIACVIFALCGCMRSKEHLRLHHDGSGILKARLVIPEGTRYFIDQVFGAMFEGLAQGMSEIAGKDEKMPQKPSSFSDEMFADQDEFIKKAQEAGASIKFLEFNRRLENEDLVVDYMFEFDDIAKLLKTGIIKSNIELIKNAEGSLVCSLKKSKKKAEESKSQVQQFKSWEESDDAAAMDPVMRQKIEDAFKDFELDFTITLPNEISSVSGLFEKKDLKTASINISGNLLNDPAILERLNGLSQAASKVICRGDGITFYLGQAQDAKTVLSGQDAVVSYPQAGSRIKVSLVGGKICRRGTSGEK